MAGSSRSAPRTEIERIVPVAAATGAGEDWAGEDWAAVGAGWAAVGAGWAAAWANNGDDRPPRIVPTRSIAPLRVPIDLGVEITRSRLLLLSRRLPTPCPSLFAKPCPTCANQSSAQRHPTVRKSRDR